jgi:hypothetical protein
MAKKIAFAVCFLGCLVGSAYFAHELIESRNQPSAGIARRENIANSYWNNDDGTIEASMAIASVRSDKMDELDRALRILETVGIDAGSHGSRGYAISVRESDAKRGIATLKLFKFDHLLVFDYPD